MLPDSIGFFHAMISIMLIDGRHIAEHLRGKLTLAAGQLEVSPTLAIVIVGENPVVESFVRIKKKFGESIGATILEFRFPSAISGEVLRGEVEALSQRTDVDGVIIQLPLPDTIDVDAVLNAVPVTKDVDMLSRESVALFRKGEAMIFPPVAGAVQEILERNNVSVEGMEVLVLGYGRLVGVPVSILLRHNHAHVTVIDKPVADLREHVRESALIISGVGKSGLITPDMLSGEPILIDAGTSESGGKIVGDIDPACGEFARLMTPVPGGVGPIAVAMLFRNLILLRGTQHKQ